MIKWSSTWPSELTLVVSRSLRIIICAFEKSEEEASARKQVFFLRHKAAESSSVDRCHEDVRALNASWLF